MKVLIACEESQEVCKAFREARYIEKLGTGLLIIFSVYEERKLKIPEFIDGENYVKCILPRGVQVDSGEIKNLLAMFDHQEEISVQDVMHCLNTSRASAGRRLKELVEKGKIVRIGSTKAVRYRVVRPEKVIGQ